MNNANQSGGEGIRARQSVGLSAKRGFSIGLITFLFIIMVLNFPFGTVGAGERGVQLRFGAVTGKVFNEGLYFRIPFVERVQKMDVKIQKDEVAASAASKDLQIVTSRIALNRKYCV